MNTPFTGRDTKTKHASFSPLDWQNEAHSNSGQITDTFFNISDTFTNYVEIQTYGYNCLYKAQRYGKWFFLKGVLPEYRDNSAYKLMLSKEFDICISLNHPNIVQALSKEDDPVIGPCIVMEYIDGCTLDDCIKQGRKCRCKHKVVRQILNALDYLHNKQIVHHDLKPANIMITNNGCNVKIIDFGLADADNFNFYKKSVGTSVYMAPEMQQRDYLLDSRSDLYSFGKVLRLITKRTGYVVWKCLRSKPERRFKDAHSIIIYFQVRNIIIIVLSTITMLILLLLPALYYFSVH